MSKDIEILLKNLCTIACEYNDSNVCIACHRNKKEIFDWGDYSEKSIEINKIMI
jgi:predicted Fe-S protein YdhL (DUF1289 family)